MKLRAESILSLNELRTLFAARLRDVFRQTYATLLDEETLTETDVEYECNRFYEKRRSSLQQVYSHYARQWEAFHTFCETPDERLRDYLSQSVAAFKAGYDDFELNINYYRKRFLASTPGSAAWKQLREAFTCGWHKRLSDREYNYQLQHIELLCTDFRQTQQERCEDVLTRSHSADGLGRKLIWLQLQRDPALRKKLEELTEVVRRSPIVRELQKCLGRYAPHPDQQYLARQNREALNRIHHRRNGSIRGVTEGNNLNRLLPSEYAWLAEPQLYGQFLRRYAGHKLQMYDVEDVQTEHVSPSVLLGNDLSSPAVEGPFVVCLDTSASMKGSYELVAKAILLAMGYLSERTQRRCKVLLFSEEVTSYEVHSLSGMLDQLGDFFCQSFHSGTDLIPALHETLKTLEQPEYSGADVLLMSDFETDPLPPYHHTALLQLKASGTQVYTVMFGHEGNAYYETIGNCTWYYR